MDSIKSLEENFLNYQISAESYRLEESKQDYEQRNSLSSWEVIESDNTNSRDYFLVAGHRIHKIPKGLSGSRPLEELFP